MTAAQDAEDDETEARDESSKKLTRSGIAFIVVGAISAGITYYTFDTRRKAEAELSSVRLTNQALIAAGITPQSTSELGTKIKLNRGLSIGFGIGAAVALIAGGVLLLAGHNRATKPARSITWAPRGTGIEVAF